MHSYKSRGKNGKKVSLSKKGWPGPEMVQQTYQAKKVSEQKRDHVMTCNGKLRKKQYINL